MSICAPILWRSPNSLLTDKKFARFIETIDKPVHRYTRCGSSADSPLPLLNGNQILRFELNKGLADNVSWGSLLDDEMAKKIFSTFSRRLLSFRADWRWTNVTFKAMPRPTGRYDNVRKFTIHGCRNADPECVLALINEMPLLEHLTFVDVDWLNDEFVRNMLIVHPTLVSLTLTGCCQLTFKTAYYIIEYCKSLRSLDLLDCHNLNGDAILRAVFNAESPLFHLRSLKYNFCEGMNVNNTLSDILATYNGSGSFNSPSLEQLFVPESIISQQVLLPLIVACTALNHLSMFYQH
jgi:hypothetical protein